MWPPCLLSCLSSQSPSPELLQLGPLCFLEAVEFLCLKVALKLSRRVDALGSALSRRCLVTSEHRGSEPGVQVERRQDVRVWTSRTLPLCSLGARSVLIIYTYRTVKEEKILWSRITSVALPADTMYFVIS